LVSDWMPLRTRLSQFIEIPLDAIAAG
jgi:hypothetical protein